MQHTLYLFSLISVLSVNSISYSAQERPPAQFVSIRGFSAPILKGPLQRCDVTPPRTGLGSSWINFHLHEGGKGKKPPQNELVSQWFLAEDGACRKRQKRRHSGGLQPFPSSLHVKQYQLMGLKAHENAGVPVHYLD